MVWMEITNRNSTRGSPDKLAILCCSVSVVLSISCDRVQERRPSLERVLALHEKHVVLAERLKKKITGVLWTSTS